MEVDGCLGLGGVFFGGELICGRVGGRVEFEEGYVTVYKFCTQLLPIQAICCSLGVFFPRFPFRSCESVRNSVPY